MSEGTKQRMRESAALRPAPTEEFKAKVAEGVRAYYAEHEVSEETRKKLADTSTGRPVSEKSRLALIERNKAGKGETRTLNLSDAERQRRVDANKARAGKPRKGMTPEQRAIHSEKLKAAWEARRAAGVKRGDGRSPRKKPVRVAVNS